MIKRLEHEKLVEIDGRIRLTTRGRALAEQVVRRHRLAERFLTDIPSSRGPTRITRPASGST
jgi:DtxR family Mn-dependent transcriptional regulator